MSKQRRPPERETSKDGERSSSVELTLEGPSAGAQTKALEGGALVSADLGGAALATSAVADLAGRVALALRFGPRDPASVERLASLVEMSALSADRRQAILERLRGDLDLAGRVSEALRQALGRDDPAERSALIDALDRASATATDGRSPDQIVADRVAADTGHPAGDVASLCRALSGWIVWWEEEEEEAPPGDYAAEEGGT